MIIAAVPEVSGVRHVHDPVHKSQRAAVFLRQGNERNTVVAGGSVHIHRPAGVRRAGVHVQRINEMFNGSTRDQCIEEKGSGGEIDNGRANGADRVDVAAGLSPEVTAGPTVRDQITAPVVALSA